MVVSKRATVERALNSMFDVVRRVGFERFEETKHEKGCWYKTSPVTKRVWGSGVGSRSVSSRVG